MGPVDPFTHGRFHVLCDQEKTRDIMLYYHHCHVELPRFSMVVVGAQLVSIVYYYPI